jgi:hypothetical protein
MPFAWPVGQAVGHSLDRTAPWTAAATRANVRAWLRLILNSATTRDSFGRWLTSFAASTSSRNTAAWFCRWSFSAASTACSTQQSRTCSPERPHSKVGSRTSSRFSARSRASSSTTRARSTSRACSTTWWRRHRFSSPFRGSCGMLVPGVLASRSPRGLLVLASPWVLPWYAVWIVPLAAVEEDRLAWVLALVVCASLMPDRVPL